MDRRKFLAGILGVASAAAVAATMRPGQALAAMPSAGRGGILDELEADIAPAIDDGEQLKAEPVWHYGYPHRRPWRRRRPRLVWRRVCRRVRTSYGWRRRCWRQRVRIW